MSSAGEKRQNADQFIANWFKEVIGPDPGIKEGRGLGHRR